MFLPFRTRRMPTLEELEEQRLHRSAGIRGMLKVAGIIVLVVVAFISSMLLLTPMLELHTLEQERDRALAQLERTRAIETEARNRFLWMSDPEYFEQIARDRANQAKAGEYIIRRPTAEQLQQMQKDEQKKQERKKRRPRG